MSHVLDKLAKHSKYESGFGVPQKKRQVFMWLCQFFVRTHISIIIKTKYIQEQGALLDFQ